MRLIDDPSIYPVVTTDLEGNILEIRTFGLHYYRLHDFIMVENFDSYELIFQSLIEGTLNFTFDYGKDSFMNGRLFRTKIKEDGLAYIMDIDDEQVRTVTIDHPTKDHPLRYQSLGLQKLYEHPEFIISTSINDSYELISFVVSNVKNGFLYDEDYIITYGEKTYEIIRSMDRFGKDIFEIIEGVTEHS